MKLWYSPTSPYVRKVMVVALESGHEGGIERLPARAPESNLEAANPLGKIPTLATDEGEILYDSPVICEYLDSLSESQGDGAKLFPSSGQERWKALRLQALADGILDAAVLRVIESRRPEKRRLARWDEWQKRKVVRGLDSLETEAPDLDAPVTIGHVAIGCLLGFLDARFADDDWRPGRPALAKWYEEFAQRPSMAATAPPPPE